MKVFNWVKGEGLRVKGEGCRVKGEGGVFLLCLIILLSACQKPVEPEEGTPIMNAAAKGVYILNEGVFNMNNSSISFYDFATGKITEDYFLQVNKRRLGDTGNDLQKYGNKLYAVVNMSEQIEVMHFSDCRSIKQIPLIGKQPRKIAFYGNKAYVSCFDGDVVQIDTATLQVEKMVYSGENPEGICVVNEKLYVANSGGVNYPDYGNTVSVFDIHTLVLLKTIEVVANPYTLIPDREGDIYLVSRGNYADIPYSFQRIDSRSDEVVHNYNLPVLNFTISGDYGYLYYYNFETQTSWIKVMDMISESIVKENFIADGTKINCPYGITVNPINQDVYISDSHQYTVNGDVYCFDKNGKQKFRFEVGINPAKVVILE